MRVVSIASAKVIASRIMVSRRASLDVPAPMAPGAAHFDELAIDLR
jgi:hypothetical protein